MKKSLLMLSVLGLLFTSCKDGENKSLTTEENLETIDTTVVPDGHTSENALDWAGVYVGTLPCADCEGIKTVLQLEEDNTYTLSETYLGKPSGESEFKRTGNFSWNDDGTKIILKDGDNRLQYKVGENQLMMLDSEGNMIDGKMTDLYILKKETE